VGTVHCCSALAACVSLSPVDGECERRAMPTSWRHVCFASSVVLPAYIITGCELQLQRKLGMNIVGF
jgi:hypothetical protein